MKKLYIYILIGLLCFLGFNGDVEAEYTDICKYETFEDDYGYNVNIKYDKSNKDNPYKVEVERLKANKSGQYERANYEMFTLKDGKNPYGNTGAKGTNFGNSKVYSYSNISSTECPKNVAVDISTLLGVDTANYKIDICFYNDLTTQHRCETHISGYKAISGGKVENNNSSITNIDDGKTCDIPISLKNTNGTANKCILKFKYNKSSGSLNISYMYDLENKTYDLSSSSSSFTCGKVASGHTQQGIEKINTAKIFLSNTSVGTSHTGVLVKSRSEFDKKFLEHWNETGSCEFITVDQTGDGDSTTSTTNFYLLFPDAVEACKEDGCANVDVDDFVNLRTYNYSWKTWFDLSNEYDSCEGLLGDRIIDMLDDIFLYIKILIPVALIGFGIVDFVKAVFSSKEDDMKKAQNRFIKRLIIAAIIFILPSIVNALLNTIDGIWAHINNSACNIWD